MNPLKIAHRDHMPQRRDLRLQQTRQRLHLGQGDQYGGLGVFENAHLTAHVIFDLGRPHRRIDRHRYCTGE